MRESLKVIKVNPLHEDVKAYAVTYYMRRDRQIDSPELRKFASELMSSIAESCIRHGAKVIGHIKAYIEHETGFLHSNTVGGPADVTVKGRDGEPTNRFKLVVNSIIYGITEESLKKGTEEAIAATSCLFGFDRELDSQFITKSLI